jgi:hypothetical protein
LRIIKSQEKRRQVIRVSIEFVAHIQTLKQQKTKGQELPHNLSILTFNVNGLNTSIKKQLANLIKKEDPTTCCLQKTQLANRNKHCLKVKG